MSRINDLHSRTFAIAINVRFNFIEKTRQIKQLLAASPFAKGLNEHGQVLLAHKNFQNEEDYITYVEKRGPLLVNAESRDSTILMSITQTNSVDIATWLIDSEGARVNLGNKIGVTPLHVACEKGYLRMLELLLAKGANINQVAGNNSLTGRAHKGQTPLHKAIRSGSLNCVKALLKHGARCDLKIPFNGLELTALEWALVIRQHICLHHRGRNIAALSLGSSRNKLPSLEVINEIIKLLRKPSLAYISALRPMQGNPNHLVSHVNNELSSHFKNYLSVIHKATGSLPVVLQEMIDSFLFQNQSLSPNAVRVHITQLKAFQVNQPQRFFAASAGSNDRDYRAAEMVHRI